MGMYTEIFVNVDLLEETPDEIIQTLRAICGGDYESPLLDDKPDRWCMLFSNGSYYTPLTRCANLTFDDIANHWSLIGKGDIKNYSAEIEAFFDYIRPWVQEDFMGYMRYEDDDMPTLICKEVSDE